MHLQAILGSSSNASNALAHACLDLDVHDLAFAHTVAVTGKRATVML
jgi:hypothetical protein